MSRWTILLLWTSATAFNINNYLSVNFSNSLQHQQSSCCELQKQPSTSTSTSTTTILLLWTSATAFNNSININNNNPLAVNFSNSIQHQQFSWCELQQQPSTSTSTILLMWTSATAFNINNPLAVDFSNSLQHQQFSCCELQQQPSISTSTSTIVL